MSYRIASKGPHRPFSITGGLRPEAVVGADTHTIKDVVTAHHYWQRARGRVLVAMIHPAQISYGKAEDDYIRVMREPGFELFGNINVQYEAALEGEQSFEILADLAVYLAVWLDQRRVYLAFAGESYILEPERGGPKCNDANS